MSNARILSSLLNPTSGTITPDKLSTDTVLGPQEVATASALPLSGNAVGDQAFVQETNRLYIWNGSGWYNIALINTNPIITQGASSNYVLAQDGSPIVISLIANDPEDIPITWSYEVTSGSLINGGGVTATVSQDSSIFTIIPSTNENYAGNFELTFTVSDGVNIATNVSTFALSFGIAWGGDRGVWVHRATMDYISISTGGTAITFGAPLDRGTAQCTCSNGSRAINASHHTPNIDYITFATPGNTTTFGSLSVVRYYSASVSDGVYGVIGGGYSNDTNTDQTVIDYVTIDTTGNAVTFGSLTARRNLEACGNSIYGVYHGGQVSYSNLMEYITIATHGNATYFGDLTQGVYAHANCSNETYGLIAGGYGTSGERNTIDYITISTPGNATSFGNLLSANYYLAGCSDGTKAVFGGGYAGGWTDIIQYVLFDTPGTATSFGNLTSATEATSASGD